MIHTIKAYDDRITALERERDRLLSYLHDIRICINTANRLDLDDMQRALNSAVSMCHLAIKGNDHEDI
jgi:ferritin-like protein